jgi:hypothetical protein
VLELLRQNFLMSLDLHLFTDTDQDTYWLSCPHCGGNYLHQIEYRAVFSFNDDGSQDSSLVINAKTHALSLQKGSRIPTRWGPGIEIEHWCETCGEHSFLQIFQCKGNTVIWWSKQLIKQT